ncbi:MAG: cytochrome P450 [Burkholderiaceae bacterium]|nr:cytochrome P450 [Burkholderiaceae bacterium]
MGASPASTDPRAIAAGFELAALPDAFYEDPYPTFAALTEHEPVRVLRDGSLILSAYADVVAMYRNPVASSDKKVEFKPKFGDSALYAHHTTSMVFSDPPRHTRLRRLVMGAVNQKAIARMEPSVVALVDVLLDQMSDKPEVDLIDEFAARIPVEVIGNLLAIPHGDRGPLRAWSLAILAALEPVPSAQMLERGNRSLVDFKAYLEGLVADRRARPLDPEVDVLTRLIQGEPDGERLSEEELVQNCIFLLNAGHETTANLIGNGLELLMRHPDEQRRLRDDPTLVASAVEEMLRFESPIQLNNRRLLAPSEIGGRRFDAGTLVNISIGAANRDPAQFPDPQRFDVGRKPNRHVAFGQGDHACVGMNVARMEGRIALGRLVARFERLEYAGPAQRDHRVRFRGFRSLPARLR